VGAHWRVEAGRSGEQLNMATELFYCTVRDGNRTGFLLGPFNTLKEAEGSVPLARRLARKVNAWSDFYGFGVSSLPADIEPRVVFDLDSVAMIKTERVLSYHHA